MEEQRLRAEAWTWGCGLLIALALAIHHYSATQWRVIPQGLPWVPSGLSRRPMEKDAMARAKAHLGDFSSGAILAQEGYTKVGNARFLAA